MTDGIAPRAADTQTQTLDTAVLLAAAEGLDRWRVGKGLSPLTQVAGLSLFQRALLTLQRAGITQALVLSGEEEALLRKQLSEDARITLPVRWMPIREFPLDDSRTWESLSGDVRGPFLVLRADCVFPRGLIERLRREVQETQSPWLITRSAAPESVSVVRTQRGSVPASVPMVVLPAGLRSSLDPAVISPDSRAEPAELSLSPAPATGLPNPAADLPTEGLLRLAPLRTVFQQAATEGRVRKLPLSGDPSHWCEEVRNSAAARRAERTLLQSLRKSEFEGFIDRYFNRKISGLLTRLFLKIGLSPNAITLISMAIGLVSAAAFAFGNYAAAVIGALIFQVSAIVDCCDGEVARLTFTESPYGEQLDLTADNIVHMAIFAGVAWGVFLQHGGWHSLWTGEADIFWLPLVLGAVAVVGNLLCLSAMNRVKGLQNKQAWTSPTQAGRVRFVLNNMANRDFSVLLLLFALFDGLDLFLWLTAIGTMVFGIAMLVIARPSKPASG